MENLFSFFVFCMARLTETTDDLKGGGTSFHFFMPVESISKADKDGKRWIQGIASTFDKDLQGERVIQNGIDYAYFLKHGYINDDHKEGPEHKVGEPVECRITKAGLWLKAFLYKGKDRSDYWWEHITALKGNDSKRKVGFSIQGKILRREGTTISKCWLQDVAITASPVNTNTWTEIVKSLGKQKWCLHPWDSVCKSGCCVCVSDGEDEEKALSTGSVGGQALIPESLEGSAKVQTFKSNNISYDDAVAFVQKSRGYTHQTARAITDVIFSVNGIH